MTKLVPAAELAKKASKPYPGDSDEYRKARTALLEEEDRAAPAHLARGRASRRALPPGGEVSEGAPLSRHGRQGARPRRSVRAARHVYQLLLDVRPRPREAVPDVHILSRFLRCGDAKPDAAGRGCGDRAIACVAAVGLCHRARLALPGVLPNASATISPPTIVACMRTAKNGRRLDVWTRQGEIVRHFWGGRRDGRHRGPGPGRGNVPDPEALWNMLDLTPGGRGTDWYPKLRVLAMTRGPNEHIMNTSPLATVKKALQAYADKDRAAIESVIADNYRFTSLIDNRLDREMYFRIAGRTARRPTEWTSLTGSKTATER